MPLAGLKIVKIEYVGCVTPTRRPGSSAGSDQVGPAALAVRAGGHPQIWPARCDSVPAGDGTDAGHMSVVMRAGREVRGHREQEQGTGTGHGNGHGNNVACCGTN